MEIVHLDFETRSRVDIRKCGASPYARHESTEILCLAYAVGGRSVELLEREHLEKEGDNPNYVCSNLKDKARKGHPFYAHNAAFEALIWEHILVERYGWPRIEETQWHCTAATAASLALPRSLEGAGMAIGLPVQKDKEGHRLMLKLCKPRKPTKHNKAEWHEKPEDLERLYKYCVRDVEVERALHKRLGDLSNRERYVWLLDQRINGRGIPIDRQAIEWAMDVDAQLAKQLLAELKQLTGGRVTSAKQRDRLLFWLNDHGVNVDNVQAKTILAELGSGKHPPDVHRVLEIRQQLGRGSTAKFDAMLKRADTDGRIRGSHMYHGASTGRWSGQGVQFQNVPRGTLKADELPTAIDLVSHGLPAVEMVYGDTTGVLSSLIRSMVKARQGHRFIVCDFVGVEARVLAWLAKETQLLGLFREGVDIYRVLAAQIYDVPLDQVTSEMRMIGKIATLGLGYGMGAPKFAETCDNWGVQISDNFASRVVNVYRKANSHIARWWYRLNDAAIEAVEDKSTHFVGSIKFHTEDGWLFITLPSARRLAYRDPAVKEEETPVGRKPQLSYMGVNSYSNKWERLRTYGGKLAENIVQATARDFLVDAMFRLEHAGYEVCFHVHDEVVLEVTNDFGSVEEVEQIMSKLPPWGGDCPIDAEGFESERYRK